MLQICIPERGLLLLHTFAQIFLVRNQQRSPQTKIVNEESEWKHYHISRLGEARATNYTTYDLCRSIVDMPYDLILDRMTQSDKVTPLVQTHPYQTQYYTFKGVSVGANATL